MKGGLAMSSQTFTLEEIKNKSLKEIIQKVLTQDLMLTIQMPDGMEVIIQPKPRLKPLPVLKGTVPTGWKEAIYNESE